MGLFGKAKEKVVRFDNLMKRPTHELTERASNRVNSFNATIDFDEARANKLRKVGRGSFKKGLKAHQGFRNAARDPLNYRGLL